MTEVLLDNYEPQHSGPSRGLLRRCCESGESGKKGLLYLHNKSLLLMRDESTRTWYMYNDNIALEVRVTARMRFSAKRIEELRQHLSVKHAVPVCPAPGSEGVVLKVLHPELHAAAETTTRATLHAETDAHVQAVVTLNPLETKSFVQCDSSVGMDLFFSCQVSGTEPLHMRFPDSSARPDAALLRRCSRVYRCFTNAQRGGSAASASSAGASEEVLYRLTAPGRGGDEQWYFYNASATENVVIAASFEDDSEVRPLGKTRMTYAASNEDAGGAKSIGSSHSAMPAASMDSVHTDGRAKAALKADGSSDYSGISSWSGGRAVQYQLTVAPRTTEAFMEGLPSTYPDISYAAKSTSNQQPELEHVGFLGPGPNHRVIDYDQLYKCFPEKSNGLLFRLVDTESQRWAFYNDTTRYTFHVELVLLPGDEAVHSITPGAHVVDSAYTSGGETAAPARHEQPRRLSSGAANVGAPTAANVPPPGSRVLSAQVRPRETMLLFSGALPQTFRLSAVKERGTDESALQDIDGIGAGEAQANGSFLGDETGSVDEDDLHFTQPGPDRSKFPYARIFRTCAAGVYRLVDKSGTEWGFYNDSKTDHAFVAVKFASSTGAFLQDLAPGMVPLGSAELLCVQRFAKEPSLLVAPDAASLSLLASRRSTPHASPFAAALGVNNSPAPSIRPRPGATAELPSPRRDGTTIAASYCPEIIATVRCGETIPFARALKIGALLRSREVVRMDPAPTDLSEAERGGPPFFVHAGVAARMLRTVRPDRVIACIADAQHRPLLFHLENAFPSPVLAAARARQQRDSTGAGHAPTLTADEEDRLLCCRSVRWALHSDTENYCFLVTYHLDSRSRVRAKEGVRRAARRRTSRDGSPTTGSIVSAHSRRAAQQPTVHSAASVPPSSTNTPSNPALAIRLELASPTLDAATAYTPERSAAHGTAGARSTAFPLSPQGSRAVETAALAHAAVVAARSPFDRTLDEVCDDFAHENAQRQQATREGSPDVLLLTTVVDPLATVVTLEGEVVGSINITVRYDDARENKLVSFENAQPHIFDSLQEFDEYCDERDAAAAAKAETTAGAHSQGAEHYVDNMLENPHLRFYRLMPKHNSGVLFRIVNDERQMWSFYNDATSYRFTVQVIFLEKSEVTVAGRARDVTASQRALAAASPDGRKSSLLPTPIRRTSLPSGTSITPLQQRRLSDARTPAAAAETPSPNSSGHSPGRVSLNGSAAINFFSDATCADDSSARVIEVEVEPLQTELFVVAHDVVRFRTMWFPTLVVPATDTH